MTDDVTVVSNKGFYCQLPSEHRPVILLSVHLASFAHNFVSGLQIYFFSESQDAIVLDS